MLLLSVIRPLNHILHTQILELLNLEILYLIVTQENLYNPH